MRNTNHALRYAPMTLALALVLGAGCSKYTEECHATHLTALELSRTYPDLKIAALRGDRARFDEVKAKVEALADKLAATKMSGDSRKDRRTESRAHEYAEQVRAATPALERLLEAVEAHTASGAEGPAPNLSNLELSPELRETINVNLQVSMNLWEKETCKS